MTRNDAIASLAVNSWINRDRVVWPEANLRWAGLTEAKLSEADLSGANLTGADLRWAGLTEADLTGAVITLGTRTFTLTEETAR